MADLTIIMLAHNRPRLTRQAIDSLLANTRSSFRLVVVDDCSMPDMSRWLDDYQSDNCRVLHSRFERMGPGKARNIGIRKASEWGRGEWLYTCDNDSWHRPGWDEVLHEQWNRVRIRFKGPLALGGYCHPFQQRGAFLSHPEATAGYSVRELEALGLLSWLMEWQTWDELGPFAHSPDINGSEDWDMSQRLRKLGGKVAVVEPAVVVNCGLTGSNGRLSLGGQHIYSQQIPEGVVVE